MTPRCETCRYWVGPAQGERGCCYRYPPVDAALGKTRWPPAYRGDWCGEYREKERP